MKKTYDYTAKNLVRGHWFGFLPNEISDDSKILYLPGLQNLELPGYQARRIDSSNLFGVERDKKIARAIIRSGRDALENQFQLFEGNVAEFVDYFRETHPDKKLFAANLDFEGIVLTVAPEIMRVFEIFPNQKDGYLGITTFASREVEMFTEGMLALSVTKSVLGAAQFMEQLGRVYRQGAAYCSAMESNATPQNFAAREFFMLVLLARAIVAGQSIRDTEAKKFVSEFDIELEKMRKEIGAFDNASELAHSRMIFVENAKIKTIFENILIDVWPLRLERYLYLSRSNCRMQVCFVKFCKVEDQEDFPTLADVLEQFVELFVRMPIIQIDSMGTEIAINPRV